MQRARRPLDPQNNLEKGFSLGRGRGMVGGPGPPPANLRSALVDSDPAPQSVADTRVNTAGESPAPAAEGEAGRRSRGEWCYYKFASIGGAESWMSTETCFTAF